jgi:protein involved in polysaccharide export with SLBB domain
MMRTAGQSERHGSLHRKPTAIALLLLTILFVPVLIATQVSCISPGAAPATIGFVEPPRAELAASLAQDRVKASDVLELKLADGTKATVTQTFQVAPDGTIEISGQGKVQVAGKTLQQAQEAVQAAVAVSSSVKQAVELAMSEYYLVTVDPNGVRHLTRVPIKGEPKVRDALANLNVSDKLIWIARPDPSRYLSDKLLAVDWESIAHDPNNRSNYKLQPGDWLFVATEPANGFARVYNAFAGMATNQQVDRKHVE